MADRRHVIWFDEPDARSVEIAGGKGASLAAMAAEGLSVPPGFVIPADVLKSCVDADVLRHLAKARDHAEATKLVSATATLHDSVLTAYAELGGKVAVRSSASAEDSQAASYAGQQETFLNVEGAENVRRCIIACWASFFSERAIFYRALKGSLDDLQMAVVVQKMVAADKAGVIFTVHPVTKRRDRMLIEAVNGLGEPVVSGEVTPDHYVVDRTGRRKREQTPNGGVLDDAELGKLSEIAVALEKYYGCPQDIEWALQGGRIYLLQSRPVTTL